MLGSNVCYYCSCFATNVGPAPAQNKEARPIDVKAFQKVLGKLARRIQAEQLPLVALDLFSAEIVKEHVVTNVTDESTSAESRAVSLVMDVFTAVKANPALLDDAYTILTSKESKSGKW